MKNFLFLFSLIFILSACNDEEPEPVPPIETIGTVTATVDGMTFNSTIGTGTIVQFGETAEQFNITGPTNILNPTAAGAINLTFMLPIDGALEVDTYSFAGTDCSFTGPITEICGLGGVVMNLNQDGYSSECGDCSLNVSVTAVDWQDGGTIKGTFTGMFQDLNSSEIFPVTDGAFEVSISDF